MRTVTLTVHTLYGHRPLTLRITGRTKRDLCLRAVEAIRGYAARLGVSTHAMEYTATFG